MQIQLRQSEIVTALKQYIAQQGINLDGKDVVISFTAGRKESGITAEVAIDDADIPGYSVPSQETPTLQLVATAPAPELGAVMAKANEAIAELTGVPDPTPEVVEKIAKSVSLFN